jgi:thiol-disulfide isomerase/thioredoxin
MCFSYIHKHALILLCYLFLVPTLSAQNGDTSKTYSFLSADLNRLQVEEGSKGGNEKTSFSLDEVIIYDVNGTKILPPESYTKLMDDNYQKQLFVDSTGTVKAVVLVPDKNAPANKQLSEKDYTSARISKYSKSFPLAKPFKLSSLERGEYNYTPGETDSVIVMNFWFINCKPCVAEIPDLNEIVDAFSGKKVKFLAITFDPKDKVKEFLKDIQFQYEIAYSARDIIQNYEVESFPTHVIIKQDGKIVFWESGLHSGIKHKLSDMINYALK